MATAGAAVLLLGLPLTWRACQRPLPPSIVLAVLDTTRADAVSAYGFVDDTTPTLDGLAQRGLLYEHAFANSNWTLPSHATLFTGLLPAQHGVRFAEDALDQRTLAERLRDHGYETVAVRENPWLDDAHGMARGFETFVGPGSSMAQTVAAWLQQRDDDRPFFLFLNIMDSHAPYRVRETNPFLPPGTTRRQAQALADEFGNLQCAVSLDDPAMQIAYGLYLGNVRSADAKLGEVLEVLAPVAGPLIVLATSDHGEQFGEHERIEHDVGIGRAVIHVPLIVAGLPGTTPGRIRAPVQLADVAPTILRWAGLPVPRGLAGQPLPTREPWIARPRTIVAEYNDPRDDAYYEQLPAALSEIVRARYRKCTDEQRVAGDMRAVIRFPYEWIWYERHTPQLFHLVSDPHERSDLSADEPHRVAELAGALGRVEREWPGSGVRRAVLDEAQSERLRALGYFVGASEPTTIGP